jgi:hypothetical protein
MLMSFPNINFYGNSSTEQSSLVIAPQIIVTRSCEPEPKPTCRINYAKNPSFVGREVVLESIEDNLYECGSAALTGPGGIG